MTEPADSPQQSAVRRVVGIAALRKLRRMADADRALARRLLTVTLVIAALGLGFLLKNSIFG